MKKRNRMRLELHRETLHNYNSDMQDVAGGRAGSHMLPTIACPTASCLTVCNQCDSNASAGHTLTACPGGQQTVTVCPWPVSIEL